MNQPLRPHIGHHIIATIAVKKLLLGWDHEGEGRPIWALNAPDEIRKALLTFAEDHAEEQP